MNSDDCFLKKKYPIFGEIIENNEHLNFNIQNFENSAKTTYFQ